MNENIKKDDFVKFSKKFMKNGNVHFGENFSYKNDGEKIYKVKDIIKVDGFSDIACIGSPLMFQISVDHLTKVEVVI